MSKRRRSDNAVTGQGSARAQARIREHHLSEMEEPMVEDNPLPYRSVVEYLSVRNAVIGLAVLEIIVIVILLPLSWSYNMKQGIDDGFSERNYKKAYSHLEKMNFWFGVDPKELAAGGYHFSINPLTSRSPNEAVRLYIDGAVCQMELGEYDKANELLNRLTPEAEKLRFYTSNRWKIPYIKGRIALAKGDKKVAMEQFAQALKLNPKSGDVNFYAGEVLFKEGRYMEAATFLSIALDSDIYKPLASPYIEEIRKKLAI